MIKALNKARREKKAAEYARKQAFKKAKK